MPTNVVPVSSFDAAIPAPDDGEDVDRASLTQFVQPLANREEFLKDEKLGSDKTSVDHALTIDAGGSVSYSGTIGVHAYANPKIATQTVAFNQSMAAGFPSTSDWIFQALEGWTQNVISGALLFIPFTKRPITGTLKSVVVNLEGSSGHAGSPGTPPGVALYRRGSTDSVATQVELVSDTLTGVPSPYEDVHTINVNNGGALHSVNLSANDVFLAISGESGANSQTGLRIVSAGWLVEVNEILP